MNDEQSPQSQHPLLRLQPIREHRHNSRRGAHSCTLSASEQRPRFISSTAAGVACTAAVVTTNHGVSLHLAASRRSRASETSATLMACLSEPKTALIQLSRSCRCHLPSGRSISDWSIACGRGVWSDGWIHRFRLYAHVIVSWRTGR
jgi:hypothetical protein